MSVDDAVAMHADLANPGTVGGEIVSYSFSGTIVSSSTEFSNLSVAQLDADLGAVNTSTIQQHNISVVDRVTAIETDLASGASVIEASGLPTSAILATDASVSDALNFLNNTPGTAGHVADTFEALSVTTDATQQQLDQSKCPPWWRSIPNWYGGMTHTTAEICSPSTVSNCPYGTNQTFVGENGNDGRVNLLTVLASLELMSVATPPVNLYLL